LVRDQVGAQRDLWRQVGDYLRSHPTSPIARALDNPLTLTLAREGYSVEDPTVLMCEKRFPTVEAVRDHLVSHILVDAYPDERERAEASRWLSWIASRMEGNRDLAWWVIPNWLPRWPVRLALGLLMGLISGLLSGVVGAISYIDQGWRTDNAFV